MVCIECAFAYSETAFVAATFVAATATFVAMLFRRPPLELAMEGTESGETEDAHTCETCGMPGAFAPISSSLGSGTRGGGHAFAVNCTAAC